MDYDNLEKTFKYNSLRKLFLSIPEKTNSSLVDELGTLNLSRLVESLNDVNPRLGDMVIIYKGPDNVVNNNEVNKPNLYVSNIFRKLRINEIHHNNIYFKSFRAEGQSVPEEVGLYRVIDIVRIDYAEKKFDDKFIFDFFPSTIDLNNRSYSDCVRIIGSDPARAFLGFDKNDTYPLWLSSIEKIGDNPIQLTYPQKIQDDLEP